MAISQWAECDNCGKLEKTVDHNAPTGWGQFSWTYSSGSGLDAARSSRQQLLCERCRKAAQGGLNAAKDEPRAA